MGWLYWTIVLLSLLGALCGWLFAQSADGMAWGIVIGISVALWVSLSKIARLIYPDSFYTYADDAETIVEKETAILSLTIILDGSQTVKQIRGLMPDEWQRLGAGVVSHGYRYTVRDLWDIFGSNKEGDRIYGRITQQLISANVLEQAGKGVGVTELGERFFCQLEKGDYKILSTIPSSASESV